MSTPQTMAIRVLDAMRELYPRRFTEPQKGYDFFDSIVESMKLNKTSGKDAVEMIMAEPLEDDDIVLILGAPFVLTFPAIAYSIQALSTADSAWYYAAEACYWHGLALASAESRSYTLSSLASQAAHVRHKENRDLKQYAIKHYQNNRGDYANKDDAAQRIAGKVVNAAFSTVRGWLKGVKPE